MSVTYAGGFWVRSKTRMGDPYPTIDTNAFEPSGVTETPSAEAPGAPAVGITLGGLTEVSMADTAPSELSTTISGLLAVTIVPTFVVPPGTGGVAGETPARTTPFTTPKASTVMPLALV